MKIRYKLTNQDLTTHNGCQWKLKEWKETNGNGELCTSGWLHCYSNSLLAIIMNTRHADIKNPKLFKVEVKGETLDDHGLKEGWTRMRLVKELEIPEINITQKIAFGIYCALEEYCKDEKFVEWSNNWLNGTDRTKQSAYNTAHYIVHYYYADYYAVHAACYNDDYATARAADAVCYDYGWSAGYSNEKINLIKLANKAMEIKL